MDKEMIWKMPRSDENARQQSSGANATLLAMEPRERFSDFKWEDLGETASASSRKHLQASLHHPTANTAMPEVLANSQVSFSATDRVPGPALHSTVLTEAALSAHNKEMEKLAEQNNDDDDNDDDDDDDTDEESSSDTLTESDSESINEVDGYSESDDSDEFVEHVNADGEIEIRFNQI